MNEFDLKDVQGPIEVALFLSYLPIGSAYVFWMYALDDMTEGAGIFFLYILMPGLPFLLIFWLAHLGAKISDLAPWLLAA
jgi:hypothetical protein